MTNKITFLGMGLDSPNRGVNALCIGATEVVKSTYNINEIVLISFRKSTNQKEYIINTSNGDVTIINKFFSKKDLLDSLKDLLLFNFFRIIPKSKLALELFSSDMIFDLNEGDSFSDIYGLGRISRHFIDSFLAVSFKKDLVFLPQTIGPFDTFVGKTMGLYVLKRLRKLYIRDDKAIKLLSENKIQFTQTIDLAVYMRPKNVIVEIPKDSIMININGLMYFNNYESLKNQFEWYKKMLLKIVNYFQSLNKHIVFVPHTYSTISTIEEDDLKAIKDFVDSNNLKNITIIDKEYDAQELKFIISHAELFLGSRMHACIAGLSTSVPTIGLAYSYKFKGTFSMFNSEETVLEVNNVSEENINNLVEDIKKIYINKDTNKVKLVKSNQRELLKL
jgi:polysaccharide pyruvyl transferase WcaK-like protein